jgi:hypothetical protein
VGVTAPIFFQGVTGAANGQALPLSAVFTDPSGDSLLLQQSNAIRHTVSFGGPLSAPRRTGDVITYHANGVNLSGLLDGATCYVVDNQPGGSNPITFTGAAVAAVSVTAFSVNHVSLAGQLPGGPWFLIFTAPDRIGQVSVVQSNPNLYLSAPLQQPAACASPFSRRTKPSFFRVRQKEVDDG